MYVCTGLVQMCVLFTDVREACLMSGISFRGSSTLFLEEVSQPNPDFADFISLPSHLPPELPSLHLQKLKLQVDQHTYKYYDEF